MMKVSAYLQNLVTGSLLFAISVTFAIDANPQYWASCGEGLIPYRESVCNDGQHSRRAYPENGDTHEVRCCSDKDLGDDWMKNDGCNNWADSELKFNGSGPICNSGKSFSEAELICKENDSRLCTRTEVEKGCARDNGCAFNIEYVWTIENADPCTYEVEAIGMTCGLFYDSDDRLFTIVPGLPDYTFHTVDTCYKKCLETDGCVNFTYENYENGPVEGSVCIGCKEDATPEIHNPETSTWYDPANGRTTYSILARSQECVQSASPTTSPIKSPTTSPTKSPTKSLTAPYVKGDPHFMTWSGETYDFHGVCDLVLVRVAKFGEGIGMEIHTRTKRMKMWSFVASVAVRIGWEIFEVVGGEGTKYLTNGVEGKPESNEDGVFLVSTISGFPIHRIYKSGKGGKFAINFGNNDNDRVVISTWHSFVSVSFENVRSETFKGAVGLLGSFSGGLKLARDGTTIITELNEYGQEWQVRASEQQLFHTIEGPQYPLECQIPSSTEMRRRLEDSKLTMNEAKKSCVNVNEAEMNLCIFDVLATNDKFTAGAY